MKKDKRMFGKILMILLIIFFYAPIVYMIVFSFNEGKSLTHFSGFSLKWYQHMLESRDMMEALYTTFSIAGNNFFGNIEKRICHRANLGQMSYANNLIILRNLCDFLGYCRTNFTTYTSVNFVKN